MHIKSLCYRGLPSRPSCCGNRDAFTDLGAEMSAMIPGMGALRRENLYSVRSLSKSYNANVSGAGRGGEVAR
jgi:hypothetical protein